MRKQGKHAFPAYKILTGNTGAKNAEGKGMPAMTVRERTEELEEKILAPCASLSKNSRGRETPEESCTLRTCYQRDRDRIIHCKSFRRLKHKTQVFLSPEGDHYRTRLTHTLEVAQIARTIARALLLNEDLTEAVSLGHDLGHTPFGHAGERALNEIFPGGFRHYEQSGRVVEKLEKNGQGLNLTYEVRDGIVCHTTGREAGTAEGRIVRLADRIAYLNHDIDDAERAGVLCEEDIPKSVTGSAGLQQSRSASTRSSIPLWITAEKATSLWMTKCGARSTNLPRLWMSMFTAIRTRNRKKKRFRA